MTALTLTANNVTASQDRGAWIVSTKVAAVDLTIGDVVYLDGSNQLRKAIATALATAHVYGIVVGSPDATNYAETTVKAGNYPAVAVAGNVFVPGALITASSLASGQLLYLSKTTAGGLDDTAPTSAYQVLVARAEGADEIYVMPGLTAPVSA